MKLVSGCLFFLTLVPFLSYCQYQKDTVNLYHKLHDRANKHQVTRWLYEAMFEDPSQVENDNPPVPEKNKTENAFVKYKGGIIRNVNVIVLDPFGYSVNNMWSRANPDYLEKLGNRYHITTKERVIRNIILIKSGDELDPLALSESERLLRLAPYINDARIYVENLSSIKDSVDVLVVVQDKWSTIVGSDLNLNTPNIKLMEKNILGLGQQLEEVITWNNSQQYVATAGKYSVFNIKNTFISSAIFYSTSKDINQIGASLDRPFYSPLAKWAGGVSITTNYNNFLQTNPETKEIYRYPLDFHTQDIWVAKSFPLTTKKTSSIDRRSSSFILGARYYHTLFFARPSYAIDTFMLNQDQTTWLSNIGFNRRTFYRDRYLFRFGANEDIPQGFSIEWVNGLQKREFQSIWYYSGVKVAGGRHFNHLGYLSAGLGYGTFYDKSFVGSGVVEGDVFYFSNLLTAGKWFFREFTRYTYVQGIDRRVYENININGMQMYGFSSPELTATCKSILNLDFVMYTPYKVIGFRFAPVVSVGLATLGDRPRELTQGRIYQSYAIGLLIRNEYLVANTFEVSIGLYPYMPGSSDWTLKTNPFNSYSVRARDYFIGKPDIVGYQ